MSAQIRVIAEIDNDGNSFRKAIQVEAYPNDEFKITLTVDSAVVGNFNVATENLRDFRDALSVVLDDEEIEDE